MEAQAKPKRTRSKRESAKENPTEQQLSLHSATAVKQTGAKKTGVKLEIVPDEPLSEPESPTFYSSGGAAPEQISPDRAPSRAPSGIPFGEATPDAITTLPPLARARKSAIADRRSSERQAIPELQPVQAKLPLHVLRDEQQRDERSTDLPPRSVVSSLANPDVRELTAQADSINALSMALEQAMLDLKALSNKSNRSGQPGRDTQRTRGGTRAKPPANTFEPVTAVIPYVERDATGAWVLASREVDLLKAEREAVSTAKFLRHLAHKKEDTPRRKSKPAASSTSRAIVHRPAQSPEPESDPNQPGWFGRMLLPPQDALGMASDATMWVLGASVLRFGLQFFLGASPTLWIPIGLLLVTPALIAAYQVTFMPRSGMVLAYRLFLILVGLWVGGRFI